MNTPSKILIVKLSAIGDVVHTLPLLEVLRNNYPETKIDWVVEKESSPIIEGHDAINRIIVSDRKSWQRRLFKPGQRSGLVKEISRASLDQNSLIININSSLKDFFKTSKVHSEISKEIASISENLDELAKLLNEKVMKVEI